MQRIKTEWGSIVQVEPGRWKATWTDTNGKYHRVLVDGATTEEALSASRLMLTKRLRIGRPPKRLLPQQSFKDERPRISDVFIRCAQGRVWSDIQTKVDRWTTKYFLQFTDSIGLLYWDELRLEHVERYQKQMVERGLNPSTIQHYLKPVKRTSRWASYDSPGRFVDFCANLKPQGIKRWQWSEDQGIKAWTFHQVLDFLDWLSRSKTWGRLTTGVALQGLCGLQLQEAYRLWWEQVNLAEQTIIIEGEVKNIFRVRKIPIPSVMVWILRGAEFKYGKVITGYSDFSYYAKAVFKAMREYGKLPKIAPKDLRNTIQTEAVKGGWYDFYLKRYVGHAPAKEDVGLRHYVEDNPAALLGLFREKIMAPIEEAINSWNAPGESLLLPGLRLLGAQTGS